jgi:hypothetical protein
MPQNLSFSERLFRRLSPLLHLSLFQSCIPSSDGGLLDNPGSLITATPLNLYRTLDIIIGVSDQRVNIPVWIPYLEIAREWKETKTLLLRLCCQFNLPTVIGKSVYTYLEPQLSEELITQTAPDFLLAYIRWAEEKKAIKETLVRLFYRNKQNLSMDIIKSIYNYIEPHQKGQQLSLKQLYTLQRKESRCSPHKTIYDVFKYNRFINYTITRYIDESEQASHQALLFAHSPVQQACAARTIEYTQHATEAQTQGEARAWMLMTVCIAIEIISGVEPDANCHSSEVAAHRALSAAITAREDQTTTIPPSFSQANIQPPIAAAEHEPNVEPMATV